MTSPFMDTFGRMAINIMWSRSAEAAVVPS